MSSDSPRKTETDNEKLAQVGYEPPKIIFESIISTRAGSPIIGDDALVPPSQDEPIELFPSE